MRGTQLARSVGLKRTGVNFIRVPPGKESYVYHSHQYEEEWIYVLSGRAIALIDDAEYEVNAGDFIGFPAPSVAHHMRNPGPEDRYLCGENPVRGRGFSGSASAWCARANSSISTMRATPAFSARSRADQPFSLSGGSTALPGEPAGVSRAPLRGASGLRPGCHSQSSSMA
jgi:hypothetical protein